MVVMFDADSTEYGVCVYPARSKFHSNITLVYERCISDICVPLLWSNGCDKTLNALCAAGVC